MLELSEDEQEGFISEMKKKAFADKSPVDNPEINILIGAPGSGKSSFAKSIDNAVMISTDNIIAEYVHALGIDIREDFYDKDIGSFAVKISGEILNEAMKNNYNITIDNSSPQTTKLFSKNIPKGYSINTKVMLVDEYQAAINAIERKLNIDDEYTKYRQGTGKLDNSDNILDVNAVFSLEASQEIIDFIQEAVEKNVPIEIYEFGKDKPSFKTGDNFDEFVERLKLMPMEENIKRADKLLNRAKTEDDILGLTYLKNKMKSERK